jgi:hypothetical protein
VFTRRFVDVVLSTMAAGVVTLGALAAAAPAAADVSDQDRQFLGVVKELNVPVKDDTDAIAIGKQICTTVEAGRIEPARTVRGLLGQLQSKGLDKHQSANLIWGAVAAYCPQYGPLVGR